MSFLRNRAVNWINLHSAVGALAQGMGGVFVLVILLRAGLSIPECLSAIALILGARFAARPLVLPAALRFGLKPLIITGNLFVASALPLLGHVQGVDLVLLTYCLMLAVGDTLYWTSYHAYFSLLGDNEHRGQQISAGIALGTLFGIVAPLIGAWQLVAFGARWSFAAVGVVQALAALALLPIPNVQIPRSAPDALRAALPGIGLFMADGWFSSTYIITWQIALFVSLGKNLAAYGGAMALAALVGAVSGLFLGRHLDFGYGRRGVAIAFSAISATLVLRYFSLESPWLAVSANALSAVAGCLLVPVQMVPVYNLAKKSPCALRFHIGAEGGWDVGGAAGCLFAAAAIASGWSLASAVPLGFIGIPAQVYLLRRYYKRLGAW